MSHKPTIAFAIGVFFALANQSLGQETAPTCDPNRGPMHSRMQCLTKMVHSLREKVSSLEMKLNEYAKPVDLSGYLRRSDLDALLVGYVRYQSPLAINLAVEPSTSQQNGRCLEGYVGEVGVVAHKPCNFDSKQELKWQLLPATPTAAKN